MEAYHKSGAAKNAQKKIYLLNMAKNDKTDLIASMFQKYQHLNNILFELYGEISADSYKGSLKKESVSNFLEINIKD